VPPLPTAPGEPGKMVGSSPLLGSLGPVQAQLWGTTLREDRWSCVLNASISTEIVFSLEISDLSKQATSLDLSSEASGSGSPRFFQTV